LYHKKKKTPNQVVHKEAGIQLSTAVANLLNVNVLNRKKKPGWEIKDKSLLCPRHAGGPTARAEVGV
jgi:hypothetical protein